VTGFLGGALLQLRLFRRVPAYLLLFLVIPFFSAIVLSAASYRGHAHLTPRPILAPALIGLWMVSVVLAEMVITFERAYGTLEAAVAAPASLVSAIGGRVLTVTLLGLVTILEALAVAGLGFHARVTIYHPVVFGLALLATAAATAGTAVALTALFLAVRSAQRYANTLGYPFYILAGILVPVTFLPSWLRPVSEVIYLHWSSDLLVASMQPAPARGVPAAVVVIALLGAACYAAGARLIRAVIDRLRATGALGLT
jgi:ABC-2 type transport system permease protein